ncbi:hypothetical protein QJS10_CPA05g00674 [Acorus calamus]|uniref:Late embryogenesis abundant protein LEA-2 subgroup domain-containing protein n=1 Tax=Acorus calamus TaxID=4465 RepID=A0AAV9ET30_ACOCL|nr:hypothetical protein QJS10_CPA05g00674 [Acorus calamus]
MLCNSFCEFKNTKQFFIERPLLSISAVRHPHQRPIKIKSFSTSGDDDDGESPPDLRLRRAPPTVFPQITPSAGDLRHPDPQRPDLWPPTASERLPPQTPGPRLRHRPPQQSPTLHLSPVLLLLPLLPPRPRRRRSRSRRGGLLRLRSEGAQVRRRRRVDQGFDLNSTSRPSDLTIDPEFDVTVRADNPNKKIGFYYGKRSSASVSFGPDVLCSGPIVSFYHGPKNVTVFKTSLIGSGLHLSDTMRGG